MDLPVLDVAIGLILMYVLLSLLVTTIQEGIASLFALRSRNLVDAVANLLSDPELARHADYRTLVAEFYGHPLIRGLYRRDQAPRPETPLRALRKLRLPSYVPSRTFAIALLDVLHRKAGATQAAGINEVLLSANESVSKLPPGALRRTLELLVCDAESSSESASARAQFIGARLEVWFNDCMARASGWYKRAAHGLSLAIGLAVAITLNANSFEVAGSLWRDDSVRTALAASAAAYHSRQVAGSEPTANTPELELAALLPLPLGWSAATLPTDSSGWLRALLGWIITAFATSFGAAFWFDALGRALQVRGSGGKISAVTGEVQRSRADPEPLPPPASEPKNRVARAA